MDLVAAGKISDLFAKLFLSMKVAFARSIGENPWFPADLNGLVMSGREVTLDMP